MTKFGPGQVLTRDGRDITVKTRPGTDLAAAAAMPGVLQTAGALAMLAQQALAAPAQAEMMKLLSSVYFLTGAGGPNPGELLKINYVLAQVRTGLAGDITIKLEPAAESPREGGFVRQQVNPSRVGPGHTMVPNLGEAEIHDPATTALPGPRFQNWRRGAIHLRDDIAQKGMLAVQTLLHEATHKYAGTIDYAYFRADGKAPLSGQVFTDRNRAILNADSHAWFIVKAATLML